MSWSSHSAEFLANQSQFLRKKKNCAFSYSLLELRYDILRYNMAKCLDAQTLSMMRSINLESIP